MALKVKAVWGIGEKLGYELISDCPVFKSVLSCFY